MRDCGTQRRILNRAANRSTNMDPVYRRGVLVDHLVMDSAHRGNTIHARGRAAEMFGDLYTPHSRVDRLVVGARSPFFG